MTSARTEESPEFKANDYKVGIAKDFGIEKADQIHVRVGKDYWHSDKSRIYDEFAMTVDAIALGGNARNKTPAAVKEASIQLMDECKILLIALEEDTINYGINSDTKTQKDEIFAILKHIRLANNRESSQKWSMDFAESLSNQMKSLGNRVIEAATWENIRRAMVGLAMVVLTISLVSAFAPYALPAVLGLVFLVAASVVVYGLFKIGVGIYNAWQYATEKGNAEKSNAGKAILANEIQIAASALEVAEGELKASEKAFAEAEAAHEGAKKESEDYKTAHITPLSEKNNELQSRITIVEPLIGELDKAAIETALTTDFAANKAANIGKLNKIKEALGQPTLADTASKEDILAAVDEVKSKLPELKTKLENGKKALATENEKPEYKALQDKAAKAGVVKEKLETIRDKKQENHTSAAARNTKATGVAAKISAQSSLKARVKELSKSLKSTDAASVVEGKPGLSSHK